MKDLQKAMAKIREAMKNAPNEDMKRIWYMKQLDLINQRKVRAYERLQDQARMVH